MLSDLQVRQARTTGKAYALADFDGLYLHISANGFKAWHFRFTWGRQTRAHVLRRLSRPFPEGGP